jgi:pantetheine-phosphate adenylyltransferase
MSHALIPGSFDPMTLGHLNIVKRALSHYDKVTVAVMINEKKTYLHTLEQRAEMARLTLAGLPNVEVITDAGMLVDLFDRIGADVIVKGIRNEADRVYEEEMAAFNIAKNPRAKTVFLQAADDYETVNSTSVRELLANGKMPDDLVAPSVLAYLSSLDAANRNAVGGSYAQG